MPQALRNVAIIAHVDHGKTTLVDAMLKQSHIFRKGQEVGELILDSNELEREKGITILAKNTAVNYKGVKINIIDTPGHADFSGEVERVLHMADGCLLIIDTVDGPMPQTQFVLRHALELGLKPIVVINKIDSPAARPEDVANMAQDLLLDLAVDVEQLDVPILYSNARGGYAIADLQDKPLNITPVFEAILTHVPPPSGDPDAEFQMLVTTLSYDNHLGEIAIGRVAQGTIEVGSQVARIAHDGGTTLHKVTRLFTFEGLSKKEIAEAQVGEIIAITGVGSVSISDTLASPEQPNPLPTIPIRQPTVQMTFGVNTSPLAGLDGRYLTSRELHKRLMTELHTNISLRVEETESPEVFTVSGRGELHLAILIETMRREGYEFQVSKPKAIVKIIDGEEQEPFETLILDIGEESIGALTENLSARLAQMIDMQNTGIGNVNLKFEMPTRGLIGFRSQFLKATRGNGVMNTMFKGYQRSRGSLKSTRMGVLVASEAGVATGYGLSNSQQRGMTFIDPGTSVYEGMIVGVHSRSTNLVVNVCKEKKLTNVRSSTSDIAVRLTPPINMSLEEMLDFLGDEEILEITPKNLRLRLFQLAVRGGIKKRIGTV